MTKPIIVPLSAFHIARFTQLGSEQAMASAALDKANACINEAVSAIVGVEHDVSLLVKEGWTVAREQDTIVCTPPALKDNE